MKPKEKIRAFVSIDIPRNVGDEIEKIQEAIPNFIGKKTKKENLHLTLKFLGEVDENLLEKIKESLSKIKFKKFKTEIDSIGFFSQKFLRIIWLHMKNCDELQKEVDKHLLEMFEKEKRFMGHLTIARVKKVEDKDNFIKEIKNLKFPKLFFEVNKFKLKKSTLTSRGPLYETIKEFYLD